MSRQVTLWVLIDGYPIDAVIVEGHDFPSEISEYPVESGSEVSDNIRTKPMRLTLECIVSNTPLGALFNQRFPTNAAPDADDPVDDIYARMLRIRANREPVPIITSLDEFLNMALENFTVPRAGGEGDQIRFTATFKQITFITNERTSIPVAAPHLTKKANLGTRPSSIDIGPVAILPSSFAARAGQVVTPLTTPLAQHPSGPWWQQLADKPKPDELDIGPVTDADQLGIGPVTDAPSLGIGPVSSIK